MAKSPKHIEKKRHGLHHKHTKQFKKVYWPYMPAALAVILSFVIIWAQPTVGTVMSYATEMTHSGLLSATNKERSRNGVSELNLNAELTKAAQAKADDMAKRDYWSHNTPEGDEPWIFINKTSYDYSKAGENLAYGFADSRRTVIGWMNSPTHKANLLDPSYQDVGFGYANSPDYQNTGPETIVVAMYGKPLASGAEVAVLQTDSTASKSKDTEVPTTRPLTLPVTTNTPVTEPGSVNVSLIQSITGGRTSWLYFVIGVSSGLAAAGLLVNHGLRLRKLLRDSENFVHHHPVLDTAFLFVLIVTVALSKGVGFVR